MRTLRAPAIAAFGLSALLGVTRCTSFSGKDPAAPDGGTDGSSDSDAALADGATSDGGGSTDAAASLRLPCPPPRGGTSSPTGWAKRTLHVPATGARSYPFQIVADATHVAWVAQAGAADAADDSAPYNGNGAGIIMRAPKTEGGEAKVLAQDQALAVAIALDGDHVYWATFDGTTPKLLRQQRDVDCAMMCPQPELVGTFPNDRRVVKLLRPSPGVLFAQATNGHVFRVPLEGAERGLPTEMLVSGIYPALATTNTDIYAASGLNAAVGRVTVDGKGVESPFLTLLAIDSGTNAGAAPMTTDCSDLWMTRGTTTGSALCRANLATKAMDVVAPLINGPYDVAADAKHVYVGFPNAGGGVFAYDKTTTTVTHPYSGNVFALTVDDDGVYFGEHAVGPTAGTITMIEKD